MSKIILFNVLYLLFGIVLYLFWLAIGIGMGFDGTPEFIARAWLFGVPIFYFAILIMVNYRFFRKRKIE